MRLSTIFAIVFGAAVGAKAVALFMDTAPQDHRYELLVPGLIMVFPWVFFIATVCGYAVTKMLGAKG